MSFEMVRWPPESRDLPDTPGIWARPNYPAIRANWVYPGDDMPPELLYGEGRPVSVLPRGGWIRVDPEGSI